MKVKNINGTSEISPKPNCKCESWLEHWENNRVWEDNKKYRASHCRCCGKPFDHDELVGGHVIKCDSTDKSWYIVPLCKGCNNKKNEEFYLMDKEDLVSVNCENCKNK